jgi:hypothetical protein
VQPHVPDAQTLKRVGGGGLYDGYSGAHVYLVRDAQGETIAVAKLGPVDEMAAEFSGARRLSELRLEHFRWADPFGLAAVTLPDDKAGLVMVSRAAQGSPHIGLIQDTIDLDAASPRLAEKQTLSDAVGRFAVALADLHDHAPAAGGPVHPAYVRAYADRTMRYVDDLEAEQPGRALWDLAGLRGADDLRRRTERIIDAMAERPGPGVLVHGDTSVGNQYLDAASGEIMFIDAGRTFESMDGAGRGIGSASRDTTKLTVSGEHAGFLAGADKHDMAAMTRHFDDVYRAHRDADAYEQEAAARRFFELQSVVSLGFRNLGEGQPNEHLGMAHRMELLHRALHVGPQ